jgi:hypothetical protein
VHIVVDGFNLIRQSPVLGPIERRDFQEAQDTLVQWLGTYRRKTNHRVTVVFDGWQHGSLTGSSQSQQGVRVVYSPRGVTADERIKEMAAAGAEDMCVVSSDGDIARFAQSRGKTAISSPAFERKLTSAIGGMSDDTDDDDGADDDRPRQGAAKKGPSRRPSKKKRRLEAKYRKL